MNKYIFNLSENIPVYNLHSDVLLVPISDVQGPQGPRGPPGPSVNIGDTGSGSVLVINPDDKSSSDYVLASWNYFEKINNSNDYIQLF